MSEAETDTQDFDPSWEVQRAIYARLEEMLPDDVDVIDNVEAEEFAASLPFVLIGDDVLTDANNQIEDEYQIKAFIRCHAAGSARKAVKRLAHQVRQAMRANFNVEGFQEPVSYHSGTTSALVEGIAHVAIVEWTFDLLPEDD